MTRAEQCVEWIKVTKGIDFHDRFGLIPLILEWADTIDTRMKGRQKARAERRSVRRAKRDAKQ